MPATTELPRVSIVILNWNGLKDTLECLQSVQAVAYPKLDTIVVDNASSGDDAGAIERDHGSWVRVIRNKENVGYCRGFLTGMETGFARGAKYVILLQNDVVVAPDFLEKLVLVAERNPDYALLSPLVYDYDRRQEVQDGGRRLKWWGFGTVQVGHLQDSEEVRECQWLPPACLMLERDKTARIGLRQAVQDYFMYSDPFWYLSALQAGLKVGCVPASCVWHRGSRSLKRSGWARMRWVARDLIIQYYRFATGGYYRRVEVSQFIWFTRQIYFYHRPRFVLDVLRSISPESLRYAWRGLREAATHLRHRSGEP